MTLDIRRDVDASDLSSMRVGGIVGGIVDIRSREDVVEAYAIAPGHGLTLLPIGGGTNVVFGDSPTTLVAICSLQGIAITDETKEAVVLSCGAGESWDAVVAYGVDRGWSGMERLSAIPGSVGAAPVQNIGAYGAEFADIAVWVEAYDSLERTFVRFSPQECRFGYRDSRFKREPGRYFVVEVSVRLSKRLPDFPTHAEVARELASAGSTPGDVTAGRIRKAVVAIRARKLPDPSVIPNCGSFFENPVVPVTRVEGLLERFPSMPTYPARDGTKLSAGWLIEQAGYKGVSRGPIGTHEHHALVVVNRGKATRADVEAFTDEVVAAVRDTFGVTLRPEVRFIPPRSA